MVIGERFAWGHLPKTAGDATLKMFHMFPHLVEFAHDAASREKHTVFPESEHDLEGKLLVLNIRRLPHWVLSWYQQRARHRKEPLAAPVDMARTTVADRFLNRFTGDGRLTIDRWLRTEFLAQDFLGFVSELTEVSPAERAKLESLGVIHRMEYDHDLSNWFSEELIESLYGHNPIWTEVERDVYGSILNGLPSAATE